MTHQQKLEAVRQACIDANPAITAEQTAWEQVSARYFELTLGEEDDISTTPNMNRPIRLADVLLALGMKKNYGYVCTDGSLFEGSMDVECGFSYGQWNLRKDSLDEQAPETIDFLYELLK